MSKAIGIVAEYNPFHNGHAHHLREAKRIAGNRPVIAAMSGSLVQRGLPALTDKWTRARMAVLGGVDLVLELPTVFTCRSAEFFAAGAVKLLAATGMVSHLAFGAEAANSQQLMLTAEFLNEPVFQDALHHYLDEGHSYAKSLELTLAEDPSMLTIAEHPNNILALDIAASFCTAVTRSNLSSLNAAAAAIKIKPSTGLLPAQQPFVSIIAAMASMKRCSAQFRQLQPSCCVRQIFSTEWISVIKF